MHPSPNRHRIAAVLLVSAVAGVAATVTLRAAPRSSSMPASPARESFEFHLAIDGPLGLGNELNRRARDGFSCAAVAKPVAPLLSSNAAVLLSRPSDARASVSTQMATVYSRPASALEDFEHDVNAVAAKGFRLCGFTFTNPVWGSASRYTLVAVFNRAAGAGRGAGADAASYRIIRTEGRREQWKVLEKSAADGYEVRIVVARPLPQREIDNGGTSDVLFVTEKIAGTQPLQYDLVFAGNAVALEKDLAKATAKGYGFQALWTGNDRVSVLVSRPLAGGGGTATPASPGAPGSSGAKPHELKVDDPSDIRVSGLDGAFLGLLRFRDGVMAVYDRSLPRSEHSIIQGDVQDPPYRRPQEPANQRWLVDKLNADGRNGYLPVDFTWREASGDRRLVDVILRRDVAP